MNLKNFLKLRKKLIGKNCSTKLVTPKKIGFMTFTSIRLSNFLGFAIWNVTTTLENAYNDQVYLKVVIDNFKKSTRPRLLEKIDKKELTLLL